MNSYKCSECGAMFTEPLPITERTYQDPFGAPLDDHFLVCPFCNSTNYEKLSECPKCGRTMPECASLCETCRKALRTRFSEFLLGLDPCEVDQLDEWLDGASVRDIEEGLT